MDLRSRGNVWKPLPHLSEYERHTCDTGSYLVLKCLSLMCDLHDCDGTALLEHPADRGHDPYPSIINTDECKELLQYCSSHRRYIDQCMFGACSRKPTEIILPEKVDPDHNLFQHGITCCHRGGHKPVLGKDPMETCRAVSSTFEPCTRIYTGAPHVSLASSSREGQ